MSRCVTPWQYAAGVIFLEYSLVMSNDSNVLKLEQIAIPGTPVADANDADSALCNAERSLMNEAIAILQRPSQAMTAIDKCQTQILTALQILIDPSCPAHHKAIAKAAAANWYLFQATQALDPEITTKFIEDALVAVARATKAVCEARAALKYGDD